MLRKLLCAVFMLAAGSAQAAVLEYNYVGETFFKTDVYTQEELDLHCEIGSIYCPNLYPESLPGVRVKLRIDESLVPSGTLAGASLFYNAYQSDINDPPNPPVPAYLVEFTIKQEVPDYLDFRGEYNWAFPGFVWGDYGFVFDDSKSFISWFISIGEDSAALDHLWIRPGGSGFDLYFSDFGNPYLAGPGVWSGPTPIPLPATAWLMLGLIGGLGVRAWRGRNRPAS